MTENRSMKQIHEITAEYLFGKDDDGEKRCWAKGKFFYIIKKDWDYDFSEHPSLRYQIKPPEKYRFLGYCQHKYAFKIACRETYGKKCGWSHKV